MFRRRRHLLRPSAWLALFALVLLLVAPLYSQLSREQASTTRHQTGQTTALLAATDSTHHGVDLHASHGADQPLHIHSDWNESCGYCSLLQHFPFLDITAPPLSRSAMIPSALLIAAPCGGHAGYIRFWYALKRAPPLNSPTLNPC